MNIHFPSTLKQGANGSAHGASGLNATQQKPASHPIFLAIEEELHDVRRVQTHGQEEDLRHALDMVINRVTEMSTMLAEAYRVQADLEVQLNVAKSNLQLIISNNEMLEEALRRDSTARDVGWRRGSANAESRRTSSEVGFTFSNADHSPATGASPTIASTSPPAPPSQESRFFKFRFTGNSNGNSRPPTPKVFTFTAAPAQSTTHTPSSSVVASPSPANKELESLNELLEKEKDAHKIVLRQKAALEAELESLSQALFEEANKMVATERMRRAETEEELREARQEREALKRALRVIEAENTHLRGDDLSTSPPVAEPAEGDPESVPLPPSSPSSPPVSPSTVALPESPGGSALESDSSSPDPSAPADSCDPADVSFRSGPNAVPVHLPPNKLDGAGGIKSEV
ncbi:hypothetical protein FISHEDRAFT_73417 [Fistulina hepatica ATCC 64428]|uniref:GDP/GTP exchange factor Sec2 N-terminal domain-containing protein n=1 Tax=Fistulina hepatica ATCC 64428 TaxID=1128425 RepID=A0A0D7AE30_9AGAR|nr:hypothetical protein FISHEDRAFT_73417 [Fistulina hepatica ATCC 64428]